MGSFIRVTSLLLCIAGGLAAAFWLAGRPGPPKAPVHEQSDAPAWHAVNPAVGSTVDQRPVVLLPQVASTPSDAVPMPEAKAPEKSPLASRDETGPVAAVEPRLLPPAGAVGQNAGDDLFAPTESEPSLVPSAPQIPSEQIDSTKDQAAEQAAPAKAAPEAKSPPVPPTPAEMPLPPAPSAAQPGATPAANGSSSARDRDTQITPEGDGRLSLHLVDSDIREVLQLLSRGAGVAIMPSDAVQGKVSASLPSVDFKTALDAITKAKGLVWRREGDVIFVGSQDEFKKRDVSGGKITTRLYRPNYVRAAELQRLFTPLLTPQIGLITVTSPAGIGIGADSSTAGGDDYANGDVVLVRDYENVLNQIDRVFREVDIQPLQVEIEAMILSVKLADTMELGVDFELLRDNNHFRIVSGTPINSLASLQVGKGLKVGYLDSSLSVFVKALETIGDTNVIATPRILALNKMRAEILIGAQLGYVSTTVTETSTTQAVQFLEVGTQLRIRPFISNDGMIRMELHPELSTGVVRVEEGLTLPDKEVTGVTTNIMARDGSTVVIGGLIREDLDTQGTQIPWLGSLPIVGPAFRQQTEKIDRREIIVLITPRIVCDPELNREGNHGATEFHHRQAVVAEKMSPLSRTHLSNKYMYLAQQAWSVGNQRRALRLVNLAIHFNPEHRAALDLRADIVGGVQFGDHTGQGPFLPFVENPALDRGEVPEFILEGLDPTVLPAGKPLPKPLGVPGEEVEIPPPEVP